MSAQLLKGRDIAARIRTQLKEDIKALNEQGIQPGLAVVLVGDDPASQVYVNHKSKACHRLGLYSEVHRLPYDTSEEALLQVINDLNVNDRVHGILVQLPLPDHISEKAVISAIAVHKDVDGFHPVNIGNLQIGDEALLPCTPHGIIRMLEEIDYDIAGKHAVVIGRSNIVGKPVAMLLLAANATVTICHSRTNNMAEIARQADILVVAVGKERMITKDYVKPGSVVIDVGVNRLADGTLAGDVDFDDVKDRAAYITPVPGGVGPMTITMLMCNTIEAAKRTLEKQA